jgi:hypothetical protein
MKHMPSLDADFLPSYAEAKIKVECLFIIEDKISKLESLGLKEGLGCEDLWLLCMSFLLVRALFPIAHPIFYSFGPTIPFSPLSVAIYT